MVTALQIVQKIPGRQSAEEEGDGHSNATLAVSAHPKHRIFASGSFDHSIKIWEAVDS